MKTRRQKVFATLIACLLCASFFVVPVAAAEMYDALFYAPVYAENHLFRVAAGSHTHWDELDKYSWNSLRQATSSMYYPETDYTIFDFDMYGNTSIVSVWLGQSTFGDIGRFQASDTVWMDAGSFVLGTDRSYFASTYGRFSLRAITDDGVGAVVATTDLFDASMSNMADDYFLTTVEYPKMTFTFNQSVSASGLVLCFDLSVSSMYSSDRMVLMTPSTFSMHYGVGASPEFPTYGTPDSGNIGQMESAEDQLMQGGQAGIDAGADTFTQFTQEFNQPSLARCFVKISDIFVRLSGLPQMNTLVHISLSLGLFASLLGLAGSIVSAADRKAGREAAAAARASKSK